MSAEENKNLNVRWIQAFNERDWVSEAACRTADFTAHMQGAPGQLESEGWIGFLHMFVAAMPDMQIAVEAELGERNLVCSRWTITGTHQGEMLGVPATGRQVTIQGIDVSRVVEGKIAEHWAQLDLLGVLQQIGALPVPA